MAITPDELLSYAESLAGAPREVAVRAAASRAYYAAFHRCDPLAATLPDSGAGRRGVHQQVIARLAGFMGEPGERRDLIRKLGELLQQAKNLRTRADYYVDRDFTAMDARVTLSYAETIRRLVKMLVGNDS